MWNVVLGTSFLVAMLMIVLAVWNLAAFAMTLLG